MHLPIFIVDAFATRPFQGNPAAVCLVDEELDDATMLGIAMEMNQSETAFLERNAEGEYGLRWFTPTQEVPLCGHATLASASILFSEYDAGPSLTFHTQSGKLTAVREGEWIVLDFPSLFAQPVLDRDRFGRSLGIKPMFVGDNDMFWLAELESEELVRRCQVDLSAIAALGKEGVVITAKSDSDADDFVSRVFAPRLGIPEDPVTGSAHCLLTPYWAVKLGKTELTGYQASKRGGIVKTEYLGARTLLKGGAVTVLTGHLRVPSQK